MSTFRYRAATASGALKTGTLEADSLQEALGRVRGLGLRPIAAAEAAARTAASARASPAEVARTLGEVAVMLDAGIALDRALAVVVGEGGRLGPRALFTAVLERVREGRPLSQALAAAGPSVPPMTIAMTAAGEANGRPAAALARAAETLERADALRSTIVSALVYPALLLLIATGVVALMLLWVVPQFEGLFSEGAGRLPPMTRAVLGASRLARRDGLYLVLALLLAGVAGWRLTRRAAMRARFDRAVLAAPQIGPVVRLAETARFARVLSSLVGGGVALPDALALAQRSLANTHMAAAIGRVADGLRQGGGLTAPLAATGVLPAMALSYLRTGEETAQLALMLGRLADVLDREVRVRVERLISVLTPLITVLMGAVVAAVIASIMSAIIGFDDLALSR